MTRFIMFLCLQFLFGITIQGQHNHAQDFEEIVKYEKSGFQNKRAFTESQNTQNYDVSYYQLQLNVSPDSHFIQGSVTIHFTPKNNISQIVFDLNSVLQVDSISRNNLTLSFEHLNNQIFVQHAFQHSQKDSVTIYYHGTPPNSASFRTDYHNNTPILWTLSEPYGALDWWPCKQSLLDKADSVDTYITVPNGNKVAGVGNLISEIPHPNSTTTVHWKSTYPIATYLVAIAVTPYAEINFQSTLTNGNLLVQNYVYKEDSADVIDQLMATDTLLRFYDSLIGPYPFMSEKYGHAQFGRGGGMEHQTMSFMYHFGFGLTAHELAHQWFGNKITCGSWSDIWLNEGFATYFAGIPFEFLYQDSSWYQWKKTFLERATELSDGSIYVYDTSSVSRIFDPNLSYAKAGYMLHMLRKQIGDDHFFNAIRAYVTNQQLTYGFAYTDDFFSHIEMETGHNISTFKNQWVYGQGYPSFNLEWKQNGSDLELNLSQTTSHASVSFFYLNVPLLIESDNGDSLWYYMYHQTNKQIEQTSVPFVVNKITIDPNLDLISKANFSINTTSLDGLNVYPNPAQNHIIISPGGEMKYVSEYQIISSVGKLMRHESMPTFSFPKEIDVSYLSQGEYILILRHKEKSTSHKLVISK
ncbi:T9SS type A sorting domain-containing protein [bacterium SCSIO 12643]|nr:T9SS type A sorting domain-containing protein [bacterium SCSIO 12643]